MMDSVGRRVTEATDAATASVVEGCLVFAKTLVKPVTCRTNRHLLVETNPGPVSEGKVVVFGNDFVRFAWMYFSIPSGKNT